MCDTEDDETLAEQLLETTQRVHETGRRYGLLDAKAGRLEPPLTPRPWPGQTGRHTSRAGSTATACTCCRLRTPGTRVSDPVAGAR